MSSYHLHPSILREYDIRGIVGETLTPTCAYHIGRAFGTYVRRKGRGTITIGRDGRESSQELESALSKGLVESGLRVTSVGIGPTPLILFCQEHLGDDASIMVTASHNPPKYNGFKLGFGEHYLYGEEIKALGDCIAQGDYITGEGCFVETDLSEAYLDCLQYDFERHYSYNKRRLKIAWDASNGSAGKILEALVKIIPGEHILLNTEIDPTFPSHSPDPSVAKNLAQLQQCVLENGCDLGVAFDGDGDRIGVVDEKGHILLGDQLMIFFAEEVLRANPGSVIIGDIKVSQTTFDAIQRLGGIPLMWRTGRSLIKAKMLETRSVFAGEMSGHMFFADRYYGFDDALYAALRCIGICMQRGESLSTFRERLPKVVNTPELRFPCSDEDKFGIVANIAESLRRQEIPFTDLDGIRKQSHQGWWLLRASNTTNDLVARVEARSQEALESLKSELFLYLVQNGVAIEG